MSTIKGTLTNAGTMTVGAEENRTGLFIAMTREELRAVPSLPMFREVEVSSASDGYRVGTPTTPTWAQAANEARALRAEVERLHKAGTDQWGELRTQIHAAVARAEKAEAELHALRLVCGTSDANKFETALDREREKVRVLRKVLTLIHQRLAPGWLPDWIYRELCAVVAATEQPNTEGGK